MMIRIEHREEKWEFPFVEYSCGITDKKLPLIIQLHGAGDRGNGKDIEKVDVNGFSKYLMEAEHECIAIMPQCSEDTFWVAKIETLVRFIEKLIKEYNVDENKVYLTGFSMGGYGTWFTAMARPDLFAAIAPVCGGGMPWNASVLKMPVWAFHGAKDTVVDVSNSEEMIKNLKETNEDVKYTRLEDVGHGAWKAAYTKELLEWLLSKTRK